MKKPEKIDSRKRSQYEKALKRLVNRIERHTAKRDPENAPKKRGYLGWTT